MDKRIVEYLYLMALPVPLISLDLPSWETILELSKKKMVKSGSILLHAGEDVDEFHILYKGQVKTTVLTADGTEKTIYFINAPSIYGEVPFVHSQPNRFIMSASKDCEVYSFSRATFYNQLLHHPQILLYIMRLFAQKERALTVRMEDMVLSTPITRITKLFSAMAYHNGTKTMNGEYLVQTSLTHQEIANIVGLHRVTVTNIIKKLSREGIMQKKKNQLIINDMDSLSKYFTNPNRPDI